MSRPFVFHDISGNEWDISVCKPAGHGLAMMWRGTTVIAAVPFAQAPTLQPDSLLRRTELVMDRARIVVSADTAKQIEQFLNSPAPADESTTQRSPA